MTIDQRPLYAETATSQREESTLRRLLRECAPQDWLVFGYLIALNGAVLQADPGHARTAELERVSALLVFLLATIVLVRGGLVRHRLFAPLLYRLAIYGTVQFSYFLFQKLLPIINPRALDLELYRLDHVLFGFEPAMALDRVVTSFTTEWFAFFYFGYFFLLALHVIPLLLFSTRERLLSEFSLGMLIVFCVGHIGYMLVPGFGPHRAMAHAFAHELPSGAWLDLVRSTVASNGAQKDIFPSLHTAAPTFILLFSFRHRARIPFRYTWPIVGFVTTNIVIATMFLRWHYFIDVVAGLLLAWLGITFAVLLTKREQQRRAELALSPSWPLFFEPARDRERVAKRS